MKISEVKKEKICEQILSILNSTAPKLMFTSHIAQEIARDEEFTKKLLKELKSKNLVTEVKKNQKGKKYLRRSRWKLADKVYAFYKTTTFE